MPVARGRHRTRRRRPDSSRVGGRSLTQRGTLNLPRADHPQAFVQLCNDGDQLTSAVAHVRILRWVICEECRRSRDDQRQSTGHNRQGSVSSWWLNALFGRGLGSGWLRWRLLIERGARVTQIEHESESLMLHSSI